MWDKALMNAVVHHGFDPCIKGIHIECDKCRCTDFYIPYENSILVDEHSRISMFIIRCANCGADELNCSGTYYIPDMMPGTVLQFIGNFMSLWAELAPRLRQLNENVLKEAK